MVWICQEFQTKTEASRQSVCKSKLNIWKVWCETQKDRWMNQKSFCWKEHCITNDNQYCSRGRTTACFDNLKYQTRLLVVFNNYWNIANGPGLSLKGVLFRIFKNGQHNYCILIDQRSDYRGFYLHTPMTRSCSLGKIEDNCWNYMILENLGSFRKAE